jgi:hypothetical protein
MNGVSPAVAPGLLRSQRLLRSGCAKANVAFVVFMVSLWFHHKSFPRASQHANLMAFAIHTFPSHVYSAEVLFLRRQRKLRVQSQQQCWWLPTRDLC